MVNVKLDRSDWSSIQFGSGVPTGSTPGNIYINSITGDLYIRKTSSAPWTIVGGSGTPPDTNDTYDNFPSVSTITVDGAQSQGTELKWDMTGTRHFIVDLANGTNAGGGDGVIYNTSFSVQNGTDSFSVNRKASNQIDIISYVYDFDINASSGIDMMSPSHHIQLSENITSSSFLYVASWAIASSAGMTGSSGEQSFMYLYAPINQSGTAGYNALFINTDEDASGSGEHNLLKMSYNGSEKFRADTDGDLTIYGSLNVRDGEGVIFGGGDDSRVAWHAAQTNDAIVWGLGDTSNYILFTQLADLDAGTNFTIGNQTNPTIVMESADETELTEYGMLSWNNLKIGGSKGSFLDILSATEELTISVGNGSAGVVTSGNLAPANSLIEGVAVRVTQAPGGGATTIDVGVTGSGNLDSLIDGISTALNTTGTSPADNDATQLPLLNGSATTLTVTTDSDVTGSDMKVRIVVYYKQFTVPTS
jgi:hypothetical protein